MKDQRHKSPKPRHPHQRAQRVNTLDLALNRRRLLCLDHRLHPLPHTCHRPLFQALGAKDAIAANQSVSNFIVNVLHARVTVAQIAAARVVRIFHRMRMSVNAPSLPHSIETSLRSSVARRSRALRLLLQQMGRSRSIIQRDAIVENPIVKNVIVNASLRIINC